MGTRNLVVDGHETSDSESNWAGDGQFPPFAIFDIDKQENLLPYYATRAQAEAVMERMLRSSDLHVLCRASLEVFITLSVSEGEDLFGDKLKRVAVDSLAEMFANGSIDMVDKVEIVEVRNDQDHVYIAEAP